jgi:hypothetical protein
LPLRRLPSDSTPPVPPAVATEDASQAPAAANSDTSLEGPPASLQCRPPSSSVGDMDGVREEKINGGRRCEADEMGPCVIE